MATLRERVTSRFVDPLAAGSVSAASRHRRWAMLVERFPNIRDMRVIDLGGDYRSWVDAGVRPRELVSLNVFQQDPEVEWATSVVGDACEVPAELQAEDFDLVYSNSVPEHVGGHWRRDAFARGARELAPHDWIQTPNQYFPVEPHWLFPGFQWLPTVARATVMRRWPLGHIGADTVSDAVDHAMWIELLDRTQLAHYFPDSEIVCERVGGLVKSIVAVR